MPTQGGMSREDQILTKYDQIWIKYYKNDQIHVEHFQKHHFIEIKTSNAQNLTGFGGDS